MLLYNSHRNAMAKIILLYNSHHNAMDKIMLLYNSHRDAIIKITFWHVYLNKKSQSESGGIFFLCEMFHLYLLKQFNKFK